jgi:hypothetical protein
MNGAHAEPEGTCLGKLLRGAEVQAGRGAVGVDVADGREAIEAAGVGGGEVLVDCDSA